MLRLGWLSTGRDKAARDLLTTVYEAIQRKEIKGRIAFVFSNREPGEDRESDLFLELVKSYKLPLVTLWREVEKRPWEEITRTGEGLPLFQAIRREGLKREFPLILATLRALGEGELKIKDGQVQDRDGRAIPGDDLTGEIEKALAERGSHG